MNLSALSPNETVTTQRIEIFPDPISQAEKLVGAAHNGSRQVGRGSNHHLLLVVRRRRQPYSGVGAMWVVWLVSAAFDAYIRAADDSLLIDDDIVATFCAPFQRAVVFAPASDGPKTAEMSPVTAVEPSVASPVRPSVTRLVPNRRAAEYRHRSRGVTCHRARQITGPLGQLALTVSPFSRPQLPSTPE